MTPIKFWPTSREPEFGEGAGSLHKSVRPVWVGGNINWLARAVWVVGEGARSLALIRRLRVRPVWVGENVMAREPGAFTRIRKVRPVWVGENVNWLAREPGDSERAITGWRARGTPPCSPTQTGLGRRGSRDIRKGKANAMAREPGDFYTVKTPPSLANPNRSGLAGQGGFPPLARQPVGSRLAREPRDFYVV